MRRFVTAGLVLAMIGLGCGGGDSGTDPNPPTVTVTVTPPRDTLTVGTSTTFTAVVANSGNAGVTWTVIGGAANGSISPAGVFTAGATPGNVNVVATSDAAPTAKDTAVVQVVAAPNATITTSDSVPEAQAGLIASVPAQPGATYAWTVTGGTITAGQGSASLTYSSAGPGTAAVGVIVTNLADSAVTGSRNVTVVAAPVITSFAASRDTVTNGEGTSLTAVFTGGTGSVDQGVGVVTSGIAAATAPLGTPYVPVTYTLTVTGPLNVTRRAQVSAVAVNPPVLSIFEPFTPKAPVGGHGLLNVGWNVDPGVQASVAPGIGILQLEYPQTPVFSAPGPVTFTLTVRSPADSVLTDTATITAVPPASGGFSPTGPLVEARYNAALTELLDGRVLVSGGYAFDFGTGKRSAELYDPVTGQFSMTDSMTLQRYSPMSVRLPDGRVLVGSEAGTETEIYDPVTGLFTPGPSFAQPLLRAMFPVAGGRIFLMLVTGTAVLFDPAADTVITAGNLNVPRLPSHLVQLADGRILVVGGGLNSPEEQVAEIFDPATGLFTQTGSLNVPRYQGSLTALADGRALAAGGISEGFSNAEVFDPGLGTWAMVGQLATHRRVHSTALLGDGRALLIGGLDGRPLVADYAESFDPATGQFTPLAVDLSGQRLEPMVLRLSDGRVLVAGGMIWTQANAVSAAAELFQ